MSIDDSPRVNTRAKSWVTCPDCDGTLTPITRSAPSVWKAAMIAECVDCGRPWHLSASITAVPNARDLGYSSCGTTAGYKKHHRKGEPACAPCAEAHRNSVKFSRKSRAVA